jgi:hypothetical protein
MNASSHTQGILPDGQEIAVKRLSLSSGQGVKELGSGMRFGSGNVP